MVRISPVRSVVGLVRKESIDRVIMARAREPKNQMVGNWILALANKPLVFEKT